MRFPVFFPVTVALILGALFLFLPAAPRMKGEGLDIRMFPIVAGDAPFQAPLSAPPASIRAIYITEWTAAAEKKLSALLARAKKAGINALVVDVKDSSGNLLYDAGAAGGGVPRATHLTRPNAFVKRIHDEGFYLIGRVAVFEDPVLAMARPEWALTKKSTGEVWKDKNGLGWLDPAAKPVWESTTELAHDILHRGFDEVNFDYIRFASDGNVNDVRFPVWDGRIPRDEVLRGLYSFLRESLPGATISADLFGLVTVEEGDVGVGQRLEDAFPYFDVVAPMVYPSHFSSGFFGYKKPAEHPYEVVERSMKKATQRLSSFLSSSSSSSSVKLRPWLQYFDMGAQYTPREVRAQIRALEEIAARASSTIGGWMLWDPTNVYEGITQLAVGGK
jgi:hypothetical protein